MSLRERARRAVRSAVGPARAADPRPAVPRRLDSRHSLPRLSVVVPVHNVQEYVAECLDSILGQSFRDLEVVVVDDGSTDRSAEVVEEYVERHAGQRPDVRVVTTANRGLGAARNTGVRHARGELLAFADSDDVVLPEAYASMVSVLDESGSDFVVGSFKRNLEHGTVVPPRTRRLHRERRLRLTPDDFPEILGDVFAWNKVFRRDFWDAAEMAFPEGVRYEDQPALTKAYLTAKSFDVIKRPVYFWRVREDSSSITQGRRQVDDLRDRFRTKRDSLATVRLLGSAEVLRTFYLDGLIMDMPVYFEHIPGCDDEYWHLLQAEMRDLWDGAPPFALCTVPPAYRLLAWLVVDGRRAEAETVARYARQHRPVEVPVHEEGEHLVAELPHWDDPDSGIPPELFRLQDREREGRLARHGDRADRAEGRDG